MRPCIKYVGGKRNEIKQFAKYIPNDYERYIEPFVGGGALYYYLEPKRAILNDLNFDLMTFYRQLQGNYPDMIEQLGELNQEYKANQVQFKRLRAERLGERVPNANEDMYLRIRELYNKLDNTYLRGTLYYYLNHTAYGGQVRYNRKGEFNVPFGCYSDIHIEIRTPQHSELLQGALLCNLDYSKVLKMAEVDDFIFCDPPYDCKYTKYGNRDDWDRDTHCRLAADFKALQCRALMVINKTALTEELYSDLICDEYSKRYSVHYKGNVNKAVDAAHLIVKNY